jgi:hypothetical protein
MYPHTVRALALIASVLVTLQATAGCFFYDSRWGQSKAEQRHAAQRQAPATLGAREGSGAAAARSAELRPLSVRAHATPEYVAETIDWQRQLGESVDAANAVLRELHVRMVVQSASTWRPENASGTLETNLEQLRALDAGGDVDFVLGLVGSLPRVEFSFHELGMAGLLGKHMVVRAMNDAAEFKAIQEYLDELDERERHKLYEARKRHKNAAVLLHELGHALGALHVTNAKDLMHPRYSSEAGAFGTETRALLVIALRYPKYATDREANRHVIEQSLEQLKKQPSPAWVPGERESRISLLESMQAQPSAPAPSATRTSLRAGAAAPPNAAMTSQPGPDVARSDRTLYDRATRSLAAKRARDAWSTAEPLFEKYPNDYAIQELRCNIATGLSLSWDETRAHCRPVMALTPGIPGSFR